MKRTAMKRTTMKLFVNGDEVTVEADPDMPLLWVVRDLLHLKGTKYGCGRAMCGACSVHIDGALVRSCSMPVKVVAGRQITTIEGLSDRDRRHPVQQAWLEHNVPQCGYCQPGFMMAAAKLLQEIPDPTDDEIRRNITNICRCGTQARILRAIHRAAEIGRSGESTPGVEES